MPASQLALVVAQARKLAGNPAEELSLSAVLEPFVHELDTSDGTFVFVLTPR